MKKLYVRFVWMMLPVLLAATSGVAQVDVSAGGPVSTYDNLKLAFDAINGGAFTGDILVEITGEGTYTNPSASAVLNSSGAGPALYTSVLIRPSADNVSIFTTTVLGRGVIELKGADNVTIDGDNPNTPGINRNLTVYNTAAATINYTSVIRIATATTVVPSADNITIKNCILTGNVTGGNVSSITSSTGSSNTTFGIYCGGYGGTTATDPPAAIASVSTNTTSSGTTINNVVIDNNSINQCARGIVFNGNAAGVSNLVTITNNLIGAEYTLTGDPPYTAPATTVYTKGIYLNGCNAATVTGNTVRNILSYIITTVTGIETVGAIGTGLLDISGNTLSGVTNNRTSATNGIQLASASGTFSITQNTLTNIQAAGSSCTGLLSNTTATSGLVAGNTFTNIRSRSTGGNRAGAIVITGGNAVTIQNNFIAGVMNIGSGSFSTTYNANGILLAGGVNHKVYYNSVNLYGESASIGSNSINCLAISANTLTGIDVRNNIFSNTVTGGAATDAHTCVFLPFTATSAMNLTLNNNAYYTGTLTGKSGVAFAGATTYNAANVYDAANFNPLTTTPAANFRSFSSLLGVTTNDNASFASTLAAPFTSPTDLHIPAETTTQVESGGTILATIATDIDSQNRFPNTPYPDNPLSPAVAPDMGADEFGGTKIDNTPPTILYTPLLNTASTNDRTLVVNITDLSGVGSGLNQPVLYWKINAAATYTGPVAPTSVVGSAYTFTFGAGTNTGDVVSYFIVAQDGATPANVGSSPTGATVTANPPLASVGPPAPSTYMILATLCGNFTVGTGGDYATLTAAIAEMNAKELCGPLTLTLLDAAYSSETFPLTIQLNPGSGPANPVTIKPAAGVQPLISGVSDNGPLLKILTSYVTIEGSNTGGTSRDLTFANTSTTGPVVIWIASPTPIPITQVEIKNCHIVNGSNTTTAMFISDGGSTSAPGYFSNITVRNNSFKRAYFGIYTLAVPLAGNGNGLLITGNDMNGTGTDALLGYGIYVQGVDGATISGNNIANITQTGYTHTITGIWFATGTINSTISGNVISNLSYTGTSSYSPRGIAVSSGMSNANILVTGNTVTGIRMSGTNPAYGIYVFSVMNGVTVEKNRVSDIENSNNGGYAARGIWVNTTVAGSNVTIKNNFVSNVRCDSDISALYWGVGIGVEGNTGGIKVYDNSVNLYGTYPGQNVATGHACFAAISTGVTDLDVRGNIFVNTFDNAGSTTDKSYAISSSTAATPFSFIDYNDYYVSGAPGVLGFLTADQIDLDAWKSVTLQDEHSISADPYYLTEDDLHINPSLLSPVSGAGVSLAPAVVDDIDGNLRSDPPDIGADEFEELYCSGANGGTAVGSIAYCVSGSPVIAASGYSFGIGSAYQWEYSNDNFVSDVHDFTGETYPAILTTGTVTETTWYRLRVTCDGSDPAYSNVVTVTINPLPSVTVSPETAAYCVTGSVELTASGADTYTWSPPTGLNTTVGASVIASPAATTTYTATGTNTTTGCINTAMATITVHPNPPAVTVTPSTPEICVGAIQQLDANAAPVNPLILNENFNGTAADWTTVNLSTGGTPADAAWTLRPDGYVYSSYTFHSNDNSQFYMTNSDDQGSGSTTRTELISPAFSTIGYSSLTLTFWHYLNYLDTDTQAKVEISTDGGSTWAPVPLLSFTSDQGSAASFVQASADMTAYTGQGNIKIRFRFYDTWGYYWCVDNVSITGVPLPMDIVWSPVADLYTNASATAPYTGGHAATVWAMPATTTTYAARITFPTGCYSESSSTVTVHEYPGVPGPVSVTEITPFSFRLNWNMGAGATPDSYLIDVATDNLFANPVAGSPFNVGYPGATLTIPGLTGSTTYHYRLKAVGFCESGYTAPGSVMTDCPPLAAPWAENFEGAFAPDCWYNTAVSGSHLWMHSTTVSSNGIGHGSARANFFDQYSGTYELTTHAFDLTGLANPMLKFNYAYATYVVELDELDVLYSTDYGITWQTLVAMPGGQSGVLNTAGTSLTLFVPNPMQWCTRAFPLPAGTNRLKFRAISAYGNDLYLDNIVVADPSQVTNALNNVTVSGSAFYRSGGVMTVAGGGSFFDVTNTGSVILTAANSIVFRPGTTVDEGGYLYAYITHDTWCGAPLPTLPAVSSTETKTGVIETVAFSLYPNPASGSFTLEQKGSRTFDKVSVVIYSMQGARVLTEILTGEKQHEFAIAQLPAGVYFVRIMAEEYVETVKLVKTR